MLKLIGSLKTRGFRVGWMLEELGLPFEHVDAMPRSKDIYAVDGGGKVPVLETEDGVVWDSLAILTYLTDREGRFTHPAGSFARAQQDAVTFQMLDEVEGPLWTKSKHSFILPEEMRVPEVKPSLNWEIEGALGRLATRLGDAAYFAGDGPTVPDFLLTHLVNWAGNAKIEVTEEAIVAHHARMTARPAYQAVVKRRS